MSEKADFDRALAAARERAQVRPAAWRMAAIDALCFQAGRLRDADRVLEVEGVDAAVDVLDAVIGGPARRNDWVISQNEVVREVLV